MHVYGVFQSADCRTHSTRGSGLVVKLVLLRIPLVAGMFHARSSARLLDTQINSCLVAPGRIVTAVLLFNMR